MSSIVAPCCLGLKNKMGQSEVQEILINSKKDWISTKEITIIMKTKQKMLNLSPSFQKQITRCLATMERFNEVEKRIENGKKYYWRLTNVYKKSLNLI